MGAPIRKSLVIPVFDQDVTIDIDFRIIEIVERVFDLSADAVIAMLSDARRVQRHKVADIVTEWLAFRDLGLKRREIREHVMAAPSEVLTIYITSIYTALLFMLNYFDRKDPKENAKKFDELVESDEWPRLKREASPDAKKNPGGKKRSSASATKPQSEASA
jgi:hypothetical protein